MHACHVLRPRRDIQVLSLFPDSDVLPSGAENHSALSIKNVSRLNSVARMLPVYASLLRSPSQRNTRLKVGGIPVSLSLTRRGCQCSISIFLLFKRLISLPPRLRLAHFSTFLESEVQNFRNVQ